MKFQPVSNVFRRKWKQVTEIDIRSLALLRITFGGLLIADILQRLPDIRTFSSDAGIAAIKISAQLTQPGIWSIHSLHGSLFFQIMLSVVALYFAVHMILGYKTKRAVIISWLLLASLHSHAPFILQSGDGLLRVMMFWMMFLPLGKYYSIDALSEESGSETHVNSLTTFAIMFQATLVYTISAIAKSGEAWQNGTAIYHALSIDQLLRPLGVWVRHWPDAILSFMTKGIVLFEFLGPLLLFIPIAIARTRMTILLLFLVMQIGFNVTMQLGLFGWITTFAYIVFLPGAFWDWISSFRQRARTGLFIYYDGDCGMCKNIVMLLKKILLLSDATIIQIAQDDTTVEQIMEEQKSWVIQSENITSVRFDGFIQILKYSPLLFWVTPVLEIKWINNIGHRIYLYLSKKRTLVCKPKNDIDHSQSYLSVFSTSAVACALLLVSWWTLGVLVGTEKVVPAVVQKAARIVRLDQAFVMFGASPPVDDGWYVIKGTLDDGGAWDYFTGDRTVSAQELTYKKPDLPFHRNQRWSKFFLNFQVEKHNYIREPYMEYICREWNNQSPQKRLNDIELIYMIETTLPPGEPLLVKEDVILLHECR